MCGFLFWASLPFGAIGLMLIGYLTHGELGHRPPPAVPGQPAGRCRSSPLLFVPVAAGLFLDQGDSSPFWWTESGLAR